MTRQERRCRQEPSDVAFHFGDRHLGFLADVKSTSHDNLIGIIKNFGPENMGIAVGVLLLCALCTRSRDIPGVNTPLQLPAKVANLSP